MLKNMIPPVNNPKNCSLNLKLQLILKKQGSRVTKLTVNNNIFGILLQQLLSRKLPILSTALCKNKRNLQIQVHTGNWSLLQFKI